MYKTGNETSLGRVYLIYGCGECTFRINFWMPESSCMSTHCIDVAAEAELYSVLCSSLGGKMQLQLTAYGFFLSLFNSLNSI